MSRRAVARRIAVVPQETQLAFDYTVMEMVLMGAIRISASSSSRVRRLRGARGVARDGTDQLEDAAFSTLSGGEKQRVVIAAALAQAAEILLLDEPTASLDLGISSRSRRS